MADDNVSVEITIEEKQALRALARLTRETEKFEDKASANIKKVDNTFSVFAGNLAANVATKALSAVTESAIQFARESIQAFQSIEKLTTGFEVLTGSADKANKLMKELTDFAATTPFQLEGIAEAANQLIAFGFSAETVQDRLQKIGDVAAGSNSDLKDVALIYGQVAAAGKLTGERLLQLQERAIPIGAALAKSLGVAESEVRKLVSSGKVGFKEFEEAFNSMSDSSGLFEGAIEKQSKTLSGTLSTLKDNFFLLQAEIGKAFSPAIIAGAKALTSVLQSMTNVLRDDTPVEQIDKISKRIVFLRNTLRDPEKLRLMSRRYQQSIPDTTKDIEKQIEALQKRAQVIADGNKSEEIVGPQLPKPEKVEEAKETVDVAKDQPRLKATKEENDKIIKERISFNEQIKQIEEEKKIKEAEAKLLESELNAEGRIAEIEKIREHENNKAEIAYQAQIQSNKQIEDVQNRKLANQAALSQKELQIQKNQMEAEKVIQQIRNRNQEQMVAGFARATSTAAQIAKKGTAEQKALATASTLINTYRAGARAYADYPFPANIAVMATTIAAGMEQVKAIQSQSFATGGVVGGFSGASMGQDNTIANVRTGEMILNGNQQKELFDIASGKKEQNNVDVMESLKEMASQPVIVNVDGREIARAVREQRQEGFVL